MKMKQKYTRQLYERLVSIIAELRPIVDGNPGHGQLRDINRRLQLAAQWSAAGLPKDG
jgi:hypothetical protein